jgi:carboxypeptidase PM20D1
MKPLLMGESTPRPYMKKVLIWIVLAIGVLFGILVINTLRAPKAPTAKAEALMPLPDSAVVHLQQAIQLPTISWGTDKPIDSAAFRGFNDFLQAAYPLLHQKLSRQVFSEFSYCYTWRGSDSALDPVILMGHYDVVPVEEAAEKMWRQKPFSGVMTADTVWGRGACDDKGAVLAILESVEQLLHTGFTPKRTIYLCFGHDEEIGGTRGAAKMAQWMQEQGIKAAFVLDEGGMINVDKAVSLQPLAVIGVQEKGYASYRLSVEKPGGHSSMPEKETAIDILSAALTRLRTQTKDAKFTPATQEFLQATAAVSPSFMAKMAIHNQWLMGGLLEGQLSKEKRTSAMIRTTLVPTMLEAGVKDNVIPTIAEAVVNSRILPGETPESVREYIRTTIADNRVIIKPYDKNWWAPTNITNTQGEAFKKVAAAVQKVIDSAAPAPYLVIGATDSRYFRKVSTEVMNFNASTFMEGYHGIDERLPVKEYQRMFTFITHIIRDSQ